MKIDRAGYPFIAAALVPAMALAATRRLRLAASMVLVGGFLAYFFRDPDRMVPSDDPDSVVSPADGRVMYAGAADARWAPPGKWKQVTIFLSPLDVHINRTPVSGRVTRIEYRPGTFLPANSARANGNECNEVWVEHDGRPVVFRQVVGILARRIVCRVREGEMLERGQRVGLMKFGSRMDVFLATDADLAVGADARVVAGETVIARLGSRRAR